MTAREQAWTWVVIALAFLAFLYLLQDILLPFVVGMAIAYFFDPLVDRLVRYRVPRGLAALAVLVLVALVTLAIALLIVPLLQAQIGDLVRRMPDYVAKLRERLMPLAQNYLDQLSEEELQKLQEAVTSHVGDVLGWLAKLMQRLLTGGAALLNLLGLLFVTPIVAFYLLRDWDRLLVHMDTLLPREHADVIREQALRVDGILAGYVRGQAMVCVTLGAFYAIGLVIVGLDFGLTVGLLSGLLSFIPYVGTMFGLVASVGLAALQFTEWQTIAVVAVIFIVGQVLEGYVLAPRFVGDRVGLHPVWVIFALFAGGALFGFLGMLLALPVAAVIGVLTRFTIERYRQSQLYEGTDGGAAADARGSAEGDGP